MDSPPTSRTCSDRGRRCAVDPARLPLPRGFAARCRALGLDPVATALAGGDDYELLFAVRPGGPVGRRAVAAARRSA